MKEKDDGKQKIESSGLIESETLDFDRVTLQIWCHLQDAPSDQETIATIHRT